MYVGKDSYALTQTSPKQGGNMSVFMYDVSDSLAVAKLPEDFTDFLLEEGRDADAREFLTRWNHYEAITPLEDLSIEAVIEMAEEYAAVLELNEEMQSPVSRSFAEAFTLLRDAEQADEPESGDPPLSWDREAALVNQALQDQGPEPDFSSSPAMPLDLDEHEYPEITVYVPKGCSIMQVLTGVVVSLAEEGLRSAVRSFSQDLLALTREPTTDLELFALAWSYVKIAPEPATKRLKRIESLAG